MTETEPEIVKLKLKDVKRLATEVVLSKPFKYFYPPARSVGTDGPGCRNFEWSEDEEKLIPSCLVGHVMAKVIPENRWPSFIAGGVEDTFGGYLTKKAYRYLSIIQCAQDGGATWVTAKSAADAAMSTGL